MAASDQIRQMVNFILQEAHEKANEIRVKVCVFLLQCEYYSMLLVYSSWSAWFLVNEYSSTECFQS